MFESYIFLDYRFLPKKNVCESFNVSFSSNLYCSLPIFVFVKTIIDTQTRTYIVINSSEQVNKNICPNEIIESQNQI